MDRDMNAAKATARWLNLAAATVVLAACINRDPVPELDLGAALPSIAAEYRITTEHHDGTTNPSISRLWREPGLVIVENVDDRVGEQWQRDGSVVFHKKLFHDDRRGIEFQMDDLRMLGALPQWTSTAVSIDPELLAHLDEVQSGWRDGYPFRRYKGEVDGTAWNITLRTDLAIPTVVAREEDGRRERVELLEVYSRESAPWEPTSSTQYEIIDFADLGDRASDPFVMKVQSQFGVHSH
jgi:hypothetical protein